MTLTAILNQRRTEIETGQQAEQEMRLSFLRRWIQQMEDERQTDHPAYAPALAELQALEADS